MVSRPKSLGFGFVPSESEHHFLVMIPSHTHEPIYISEHLTWVDSTAWRELHFALGQEDAKMRVVVPRLKWEAIADPVRAELNRRLQQSGLKTGKWKAGQIPLSRLFGKELVLLAWAIEDADPGLVPVAVKNWLGLAPEERWWLFTMTNAATGHAITGRNKGWRKAVRYALTENPVSDMQTAWREQKVLHLTADEGRETGRATRLRGERSPIEQIIADAVKVACDYLVPQGFDAFVWKTLTPEERFYVKGLDIESHGELRAGAYQELARGFGVKEYQPLLASGKANQTRLKTASEFGTRLLGNGGFGVSLVRHALFAMREVVRTGEVKSGKNWLCAEVQDYWPQRKHLLEILRYLSTMGLKLPHWQVDAKAALLLAGAVENDSV